MNKIKLTNKPDFQQQKGFCIFVAIFFDVLSTLRELFYETDLAFEDMHGQY